MYCEALSRNHRTTTLHRSETSGIEERAVRRAKEETSAVLLQIWSGWLVVVELYGMLLLFARGPRPPGRRDISKRTKSWRILLGRALFAEGIWEEDTLIAEIEELEKLGASELYSRRLNAKEVLITQKDWDFVFPMEDGSAKISGRNYEFQEPALRRESTVRRENLSGESHRDREEFRLEEIRRWRRRSGIILIYSRTRHLLSSYWTERSTYVPREESFLISQGFTLLNVTPPRRNIRCGRRIGEMPKHLRQKQIQLYSYCREGRNSVRYYNFA